MSPVITFGGLLGEATEGRVVRSLLFFSSSLYKHPQKASFYIQELYTQSSAHRIKLKAFETNSWMKEFEGFDLIKIYL